MAHRSYLFSINQPLTSEDTRLETPPKGLSEWRSRVPLTYQVLLSGRPQVCRSTLATGITGRDPANPIKVWACYSPWEPGFSRLTKFLNVLKVIPRIPTPMTEPFEQTSMEKLTSEVAATEAFLSKVEDDYVLLETLEIDMVGYSLGLDDASQLRTQVENLVHLCRSAGEAVDALPDEPRFAAKVLVDSVSHRAARPLRHFHGLRFDDYNGDWNETSLGLYWTENLSVGRD